MITDYKKTILDIDILCRKLKLSGIKNSFEDEITYAKEKSISHEDFLQRVLNNELDKQSESGKQNRIRNACFPRKMYLEDLDLEFLPADISNKLSIVSTLEFIKNGQNLMLLGSTGTGKTHIATALGIKACLEGYKVLFTTIPLLVTQMKECRNNQTLRAFENKFEKYDLVIADELGYISFDKEASELLFTLVSLRASRKSTIITTNLSFDRWYEIFGDHVLTAALIDRLTHKSYILDMSHNSFRINSPCPPSMDHQPSMKIVGSA